MSNPAAMRIPRTRGRYASMMQRTACPIWCMQIDIGEVVIDAVQVLEKVDGRQERGGGPGVEKENRFAQSAFVGIQDLMD